MTPIIGYSFFRESTIIVRKLRHKHNWKNARKIWHFLHLISTAEIAFVYKVKVDKKSKLCPRLNSAVFRKILDRKSSVNERSVGPKIRIFGTNWRLIKDYCLEHCTGFFWHHRHAHIWIAYISNIKWYKNSSKSFRFWSLLKWVLDLKFELSVVTDLSLCNFCFFLNSIGYND